MNDSSLSDKQRVLADSGLTDRIIAEKQGAVGWLTFNNPSRHNAISLDMWEAIPVVLDYFEQDREIRVVVLRGAGDRAFVSGADISQFEAQRSDREAVERYEQISERAQLRIYDAGKPTIAMVRGYCLGGGVNIALACDIRVASEDARFGIPAARLGLGYRYTAIRNLVNTIGAANARELLLTARRVSGQEAHVMGLVQHVVAKDEFETFFSDYCASISSNAPLTMAAAKGIIREQLKTPSGFDAEKCFALVMRCFKSQDYIEGRRAFMNKRKPLFTGN